MGRTTHSIQRRMQTTRRRVLAMPQPHRLHTHRQTTIRLQRRPHDTHRPRRQRHTLQPQTQPLRMQQQTREHHTRTVPHLTHMVTATHSKQAGRQARQHPTPSVGFQTPGGRGKHPSAGVPPGLAGISPRGFSTFSLRRHGALMQTSPKATPPKLRAVEPGERKSAPRRPRAPRKPPAPRAKTVAAAVKSGKERDLLVAMRDRAALAIDDPKTSAAALAALMNRLDVTVAKIASIDAAAKTVTSSTVRGAIKKAVPSGDVEDGKFDAAAV